MLLLLQLAHAQISIRSASVAPNTVLTSATYDLTLAFPSSPAIPASAVAQLIFTNAFLSDAPLNCQGAINGAALSAASCTYSQITSSSNMQLTLSGLFSGTPTTLRLSFTKVNPIFSGVISLSYNTLSSSGTAIAGLSGSFSLSFTAATLSSVAVTADSTVTGAGCVLTVAITPGVQMVAGSQLSLVFPTSNLLFSNFQTPLSSSQSSMNCQYVSGAVSVTQCLGILDGSNNENVILIGGFSSSSASPFSFTIQGAKMPYSTQPVTVTCTVTYNSRLVQSGASSYSASQPNSFLSLGVVTGSGAIYASTATEIVLQTTNPVPGSTPSAIGMLQVSFDPAIISLVFVPQNGQTQTTQPGIIQVQGFASLAAAQVFSLQGFTMTNPPSAAPVAITVATYSIANSNRYLVDSSVFNYQANPSPIAVAALSPSSQLTLATQQLTLSFTTVNALVSASSIVIGIPSTFDSSSASCSLPGAGSCTIGGGKATITTLPAISAGTSLQITFTNIINPDSQAPTSSFTILTLYSAADTTSLVDTLSAGLTFTATASFFTSALSTSSTTVAATSVYTFTFTAPRVHQTSSLLFIFPSDVSAAGASLDSGLSTISTSASPSISGSTLTLTNCFGATSSSLLVKVVVKGVVNPQSFRPSGYFSIRVLRGGYVMSKSRADALQVTMDTFAITPTLSITGSVTTWLSATVNFAISPTAQLLSGHVLTLSFDSKLVLSGVGCAGTGATTLSCSDTGNTVVATLTSSSTPIRFAVSGVQGFVQGSYLVGSSISTSDGYLVQKGSGQLGVTASNRISFTASSDNRIVLAASSTFLLEVGVTFSLPSFYDPSKTKISISFPAAQFSVTGCTSQDLTSCSVVSSSKVDITGTALFSNRAKVLVSAGLGYLPSGSNSLTITALYDGSTVALLSSGAVVMPYCNINCQACSSSPTTCTSCFSSTYSADNVLSGSVCVSACPTGYYLSGSNCLQCNPPCATCSASASTCLSCSTGFLHLGACRSTCPGSFYPDAGTRTCQQCSTGCLVCTTTADCQICSNSILYNGACVCTGTQVISAGVCMPSCPAAQVAVSGVCQPCETGCSACSTPSACSTCFSPLLSENGKCVNLCSTNYYQNAATCQPCPPSCLTCDSTQCFGCKTGFLLQASTCLSGCSSGYFPSGGACNQCKIQCSTCSDGSSCASCKQGFLHQGGCTSTCPSGTGTKDGKSCESCEGCQTCSYGVCTSCYNGSQLSSGKCYTICPSGELALNGNCSTNFKYSVVYFPCLITSILLVVALSILKFVAPLTALLTNCVASHALLTLAANILAVALVFKDSEQFNYKSLSSALLLAGLGINLLLNGVFLVVWQRVLSLDQLYARWAAHDQTLKVRALTTVTVVLECKSFRVIFGRLYGLPEFTARFQPSTSVLPWVNGLSLSSVLAYNGLCAVGGAFIAYNKTRSDQVFFEGIELLAMNAALAVAVLVDSHRAKQFFLEGIEVFKGEDEQDIQVFNFDGEDSAKKKGPTLQQSMVGTSGRRKVLDESAEKLQPENSMQMIDTQFKRFRPFGFEEEEESEGSRQAQRDWDRERMKTECHNEERDMEVRMLSRPGLNQEARLTQSMVNQRQLESIHQKLIQEKDQYLARAQGKQLEKDNHLSDYDLVLLGEDDLSPDAKLSRSRAGLGRGRPGEFEQTQAASKRRQRNDLLASQDQSPDDAESAVTNKWNLERSGSQAIEFQKYGQQDGAAIEALSQGEEEDDDPREGEGEDKHSPVRTLQKKRKRKRKRKAQWHCDGELQRIYMQRMVPPVSKGRKQSPSARQF